MPTTGFAQRARRIIEREGDKSQERHSHQSKNRACAPEVQCEISGISEKSPYAPLDALIVASEAERRPLDEIEVRLARRAAHGAEPDATPLDHQLVADWTAIRDAKLAGRQAA